MNSRVALVPSPGVLRLERRPVPGPRDGEVLIRVQECGICGSDLKLYAGKHPAVKPPMVLGHEFHGTVEARGAAADGPAEGEAVAVFPPIGCGRCYNCARGWPHLCPEMAFVGGEHQGGLSELVAVPVRNTLPIAANVPADRRVLIEPLAVGVHAAARGGVRSEDKVLIIGAGPIGLFTALALKHQGVREIVLTDLSDERLELVRRLDAGVGINTRDVALGDYVREELRPEGVDVAFDCVGVGATAADALELTCKGGRTVLVGLMPTELTINGLSLQRGERSLIGVQQYTREDFGTAMEILAAGALPASEELIRRYSLDDVETAFRELQEGRTDVLKYVVAPQGLTDSV